MKSRPLSLVVLCSAMVVSAASARAAFEPLFQVSKIEGECSLSRPGEKAFKPAEESKAYPFGTRVRTGKGSSLELSFSKGNTCRVLANSYAGIDQSSLNKKHKIIRLMEGEVDINLKGDFNKDGDSLSVATDNAVFAALGGNFRVASKSEQGLKIVIGRVMSGSTAVHSDNFLIKTLDKDDWISLLSPADRSFLRLKNMKGEYAVTIKDKNRQDKEIPTEVGTVIKIWQHDVPETQQLVVTTVVTDPQGKLVETYTVTYEGKQDSGFAMAGEGTEEKVKPETTAQKGGTEEKSEKDAKQKKKGGHHPIVRFEDNLYVPGNPNVPNDADPDPAKTPTPVGLR